MFERNYAICNWIATFKLSVGKFDFSNVLSPPFVLSVLTHYTLTMLSYYHYTTTPLHTYITHSRNAMSITDKMDVKIKHDGEKNIEIMLFSVTSTHLSMFMAPIKLSQHSHDLRRLQLQCVSPHTPNINRIHTLRSERFIAYSKPQIQLNSIKKRMEFLSIIFFSSFRRPDTN